MNDEEILKALTTVNLGLNAIIGQLKVVTSILAGWSIIAFIIILFLIF